MKEYKNILIIKMSSLGDIIHALPTLYAIRKTFSDAHITWAVHKEFADILPGKPWIDELYIIQRKQIMNLFYLNKVRRDLRKKKFDLVIDLHMLAKSALISFLTGCPMRIGYWDAHEGSSFFTHRIPMRHKKTDHIIEQLLDVARFLGWDKNEIQFPLCDYQLYISPIKEKLKKNGITGDFVILVPGSRGSEREWPIDLWGELAKKLSEKQVYCVIVGASNMKEKALQIQEVAGKKYVVDMTGETMIPELVALEKLATLHISSDTGPLHIANALKKPIIALFGPTLPERSGPYDNAESHVFLADSPGSKDTDMSTISVDDVYRCAYEIWQRKCKE